MRLKAIRRLSILAAACFVLAASVGCKRDRATRDGRCDSNGKCPAGQVCKQSICVVFEAPSPSGQPPCVSASDCGDADTCDQGACSPSPVRVSDPKPVVVGTIVPPPENRHGIVREAPNLDASKVAELPGGTVVQIVEVSDDGLWGLIQWTTASGVRQGWAHRDIFAVGATVN